MGNFLRVPDILNAKIQNLSPPESNARKMEEKLWRGVQKEESNSGAVPIILSARLPHGINLCPGIALSVVLTFSLKNAAKMEM